MVSRVDINLGHRHNSHKGWAALRHYANFSLIVQLRRLIVCSTFTAITRTHETGDMTPASSKGETNQCWVQCVGSVACAIVLQVGRQGRLRRRVFLSPACDHDPTWNDIFTDAAPLMRPWRGKHSGENELTLVLGLQLSMYVYYILSSTYAWK